MAYADISSVNMSAGLHQLPVYANTVTNGLFMMAFLFALFMMVALGLYFNNIKRTGQGDIFQCFAVGGFITAVMASILSAIPGLISGTTLMTVLILAALAVLGFFFSRGD